MFVAATTNETYGTRRTFFNVKLTATRPDPTGSLMNIEDRWPVLRPGVEMHTTIAPRLANDPDDAWRLVLTFDDEDGRSWRWDDTGTTVHVPTPSEP